MYFFKYNIKIFTSLFLLGICLAQFCYYYKNYLFLFIIIILFIKFNNRKLLLASITILLSFGFICWHINKFNQERYYYSKLENHPMVVQGTVIGIPKVTERFVVFDFIINDVNKVRLKWFNPNNRLTSGDYWQLLIKLKKPRNFSTNGSFDLEKAFFIERINAVGKVVASSDNILKKAYDARKFNFRYFIDRYRLKIADLKLNALNLAKKDLILALGLGIKQNISPADLLTFQNTGTIHLLAISGLHLSLVAGFCFYITHILCKKFCSGKILEQVSAIKIAIIVSLCSAWTYALLVGFGVATNRALIMSSIYLLAIIFKKNINIIEIYCLTLLAILILEPFESLSYGFWLSFWSVGILLYKKPNNLITTNLVMLIGLLPFSALFLVRFL
jgi:competence protein ComEC